MALSGFVRSLSKEVANNGSTTNAIFVEKGAEERIAGTLRFLLSARSTYLNGQPISIWKTPNDDEPRWASAPEGKVALVTGGAHGTGEQLSRLVAARGRRGHAVRRP